MSLDIETIPYHIARILAGRSRVKLGDQVFYIKTPNALHQFEAEEVYLEALDKAREAGSHSPSSLYTFLLKSDLWSDLEEEKFKRITQDIEDLKVKLFESRLQSDKCSIIRKALELSKEEMGRLWEDRHGYDHTLATHIASLAKNRYLLKYSISYKDGSSAFPDCFLDKISYKLNQQRLSEADFRSIVRSNHWQMIWNLQKNCSRSLFDGSAIDLTEDQKNLLFWTNLYENIKDHPDNLGDEVLNDDDMLDGWMTLKRREREKLHLKNEGEALVKNKKIKESPEQFLVVGTKEDAKKIVAMNDETAQHTMKTRFKTIKEKGEVAEQDMPDTKIKISQESMKKFSETVKNRGKK